MRLVVAVYKIWYGLRFFKRTNSKGWFILASYHHPDSITWRWSFSITLREKSLWQYPAYGPGYCMGKSYRAPNGNFSAWAILPFVGTLNISTQEHMWKRDL